MTADEYWYGESWLAKSYYESDKLRQERTNADAWLYGAYIRKAISSTIGNAFLAKGHQPEEYPQKPIPLNWGKKEEVDEEAEKNYALAYMTNMVRAGKSWGKKGGG